MRDLVVPVRAWVVVDEGVVVRRAGISGLATAPVASCSGESGRPGSQWDHISSNRAGTIRLTLHARALR